MKLSASLQASANVPFELEYAEKRLEHYRQIVSSGKLKALLETGKKRREDYFQVDPDSPLWYPHLPEGTLIVPGREFITKCMEG